jgi:hypothetical protein
VITGYGYGEGQAQQDDLLAGTSLGDAATVLQTPIAPHAHDRVQFQAFHAHQEGGGTEACVGQHQRLEPTERFGQALEERQSEF